MIELRDVSKYYSYKKPNQTLGLSHVSLKIEKGEFIAIEGPSGAGKSTLLHILGGIFKGQEGEYYLDGENVFALSDEKISILRNEKIGIIMQNFALIEEYSVIDNVMIPLFFRKGNVKNKKELAIKALEKTGIADLKNKMVREISGGEKQRCAIARCLCQNPEIILADEPTGQLDSENSAKVMEIFKELNNEGVTILIVTHDHKTAENCNRIITIEDGKITDDTKG